MERYLDSTGTRTCLDSPALSQILFQPMRRLGGSPAVAGNAAYTWAISAPSREPVFFTVNETSVTFFPGASFKPEYANVVYERPWPKGKRTGFFSASYHL